MDYLSCARFNRLSPFANPDDLQKKADQGKAYAQEMIGSMYEMGEGVPQDYAHAMEWYKKAAGQGNADAQDSIGQM